MARKTLGGRGILSVMAALIVSFFLWMPALSTQGQNQSCPIAFEKSDTVLNNPYETFRLPMTFKEEAGKTIVIEVENAKTLSLLSAERLLRMDETHRGQGWTLDIRLAST